MGLAKHVADTLSGGEVKADKKCLARRLLSGLFPIHRFSPSCLFPEPSSLLSCPFIPSSVQGHRLAAASFHSSSFRLL